MPRLLVLIVALAPALARAEGSGFRPFIDLESGVVWASRNDVAAPGNSGTLFTLVDGDFQTTTAPFVRFRAGATAGRHSLFATFAPLELRGSGRSGGTILFRGLTFTAGSDASVRYRLNSYRLTYRYAVVSRPSLEVALGATAMLRDSEIRLSQAGLATSERNTGFVPLLSLRAVWRLGGPFAISLDGDAMALRQGRTEDAALAFEFTSGDLTFRAGYRLVEVRTDTDEVYNSAWLNHVMVGVSYAL
jgi:hypothetical protein